MVDPINIVSSTMQQDLQRIEVVSNNVANVNSVGFKAQALPNVQNNIGGVPEHENNTLSVNVSDGRLIQTGRSLDLAIQGQGFFVVDNNGEKLLSRNGSFSVNRDGYLVTSAGSYLVQGTNGAVYIGDEAFQVKSNGQIISNGQELDRLQVHQAFGDLRSVGNGAYQAQGSGQIVEGYTVAQGVLETSNVDVASEMMQLMSTQKHFGLIQRYFVAYDGLLKSGINQIGKVN
ncbi:flagellar hook-basal body complex protein [Photobacterium kasasachensis]|uniref:flagellar hook-basal body complex protein n=1 Tax=Photobacterium kasasachensis TaxID=2910240 RepID=UPI003D1435FF